MSGLEPLATRVSDEHSNQLNYISIISTRQKILKNYKRKDIFKTVFLLFAHCCVCLYLTYILYHIFLKKSIFKNLFLNFYIYYIIIFYKNQFKILYLIICFSCKGIDFIFIFPHCRLAFPRPSYERTIFIMIDIIWFVILD